MVRHHTQHHDALVASVTASLAATELVPLSRKLVQQQQDPSRHNISPLATFPAELFLPLLYYLQLTDIHQLSHVCRRIHAILRESKTAIFETLIARDFEPDLVAAYRWADISDGGCWGNHIIVTCGLRGAHSVDDFGIGGTKDFRDRDGRRRIRGGGGGGRMIDVPLRNIYIDLRRFKSWLACADGVLLRTVRKMITYQSRSVASASSSSTESMALLSKSWVATAAQCKFRGTVVDKLKADGAAGRSIKADMARAFAKLDEAAIRLKRHGIRILMLLFAVTVGSKREAKMSIRHQQSTTSLPLPGSPRAQDSAVIARLSMVPRPANTASPEQQQNAEESNRLALVPTRNLQAPFPSLLMQAKWRILRNFDSDTLLGLGLAITSTHELLVSKFMSTGTMLHHDAVLHAHNVISLGPKIVGRVLSAVGADGVRALLENPAALRPVGGEPFFLNIVIGVLQERDIVF